MTIEGVSCAVGSHPVDPVGAAVLYDWIASMENKNPIEAVAGTIESALRAAHLIRIGEVKGAKADAFIKAGKTSVNPMISALFDGLTPEPRLSE